MKIPSHGLLMNYKRKWQPPTIISRNLARLNNSPTTVHNTTLELQNDNVEEDNDEDNKSISNEPSESKPELCIVPENTQTGKNICDASVMNDQLCAEQPYNQYEVNDSRDQLKNSCQVNGRSETNSSCITVGSFNSNKDVNGIENSLIPKLSNEEHFENYNKLCNLSTNWVQSLNRLEQRQRKIQSLFNSLNKIK